MNKAFKIVGFVVLFVMLFRGCIYRQIVEYTEIGTRPEVKITNKELISKIRIKTQDKRISLSEIVQIANEITIEELEFATCKTDTDPNRLIETRKANCVGYSYLFNSIANFIIRENQLQDEISAAHKIGKLEVFGINIHQYFDSAFFKDHDFNEIRNRKTGKSISIDPSLSDYLYIDRIKKKLE